MALMTLGDSHSVCNFAGISEAKIYWRGPVTMHRAARDGIASLVPKHCRPTRKDILILSFGEIDARAHIAKQARKNGRTTLEEVQILCARFKVALDEFRSQCPATIAISCILPFSPERLEYKYYTDAASCLADAKAIRDLMNDLLSKMGVPFVDFREFFSNEDGSLIKERSDNSVHIDARLSGPIISSLRDLFGVSYTPRDPGASPYRYVEPTGREKLKRRAKRIEAKAKAILMAIPGGKLLRSIWKARKTRVAT